MALTVEPYQPSVLHHESHAGSANAVVPRTNFARVSISVAERTGSHLGSYPGPRTFDSCLRYHKYTGEESAMLSFRSFIAEERDPKSDTAHFTDMDDTLFHYDNDKLRIHVRDQHGNHVQSLTNSQFNTHKLQPGHHYDFSEFRSAEKFGKTAKPIRKMLSKIKAIHKKNKNVEIVTARSDFDDKDKFAHHMKRFGLDIHKMHVRRAGNLGLPPAEGKKRIMSDQIRKNGYKKAHLYDDSKANLNAFLSLKKDHPDVEFHAHHVDHDAKTGVTKITTTKA
jgi:hypothetical protein